ncbi:MAG: type II toxin-antitoxin system PrlF family antitoxin [Verrucomicrobia bacterium]|nr:type II toxin-antitoxin system PrlF family antitoxin [Verrucomicrobiota bacterium]
MQLRKATITSKGQVTIPKDIRDILKIGPGDQIDFIISDEGEVLLSPRTCDFRDLKGFFYKKGRKAASLEEMEIAIKKGAGGGMA